MNREQNGLTLVELIIVVALLALLATTMIPALGGFIERVERQTTMKDMYHAFQLARAEAVANSTVVTICPLDENQECNGNWQQKVHAFLDPDSQRRLTDQDAVLRTVPSPGNGNWSANVGNSGYFQYRPDGMVRGTLGNLVYCPDSGDAHHAGQLIINMGGRVRYARDHSGDGIAQDSQGDPISCTD
ncbi:type IV fimbrial biogenesis protein FimT [Halospina denitrificans]|uniref:Type II secretion system protein H n=1 Tax=Halospina denitrificans TaxID=332522 RepID=A0A4V3EPG6_9GAMM|nr:GspH/FimT family pseudopilin [Halospina denitrificans]TDT37128.1 type IV fimbrial biogenesis protein FimT [Halospina denitrificans]